MVGIGVEYGHHVCPISLHVWNDYLIPLELVWLECDPHHVSFWFPFSNPTQFVLYLSFFGKFCQGMHYRGAGVPVWHIKAIITVYFVVMWSLESSLLYESSWGMMLDTISLSYSAPGANSFSFCSKVEFFCVNFFFFVLLEFDLASLEVVVAEH